ncbi:MAG: disulfide bond formation protein B [Pseudomonadota bacterium]
MSETTAPLARLDRAVLSPARWPLAGAAVSCALLLGAFAFEHIGRFDPCPMCITQRWAHAGVVALGLVLTALYALNADLKRHARRGALAMAAAFLIACGFALQHVGVEYGWWAGPASCSAGDIGGLTIDSLTQGLSEARNVVMCDEIAWSMLGVSMAGWNALISLAGALASVFVAIRREMVQ